MVFFSFYMEGRFSQANFEELELIWCNLANILWGIFYYNGSKINSQNLDK